MHASQLLDYRNQDSLPRQFLNVAPQKYAPILDDPLLDMDDMDAGTSMLPLASQSADVQGASSLPSSPAPQDRPPDPSVMQVPMTNNSMALSTGANTVVSPSVALTEEIVSSQPDAIDSSTNMMVCLLRARGDDSLSYVIKCRIVLR